MKSKLQNSLSACLVIIFLILGLACVTTKTYKSEEKKMLVPGEKAFVERNDGTKVSGEKLTLPVSWNGKSKGIFLDKKEVDPDDIVAFQNEKGYQRKFGERWVKQLKRGKINLYYYETFVYETPHYDGTKMVNGTTKSTQHFVFQKGNDKMIEAAKEQISEMLKDNPEAYEKFNNEFKPDRHLFPKQLQNKPGKLFAIIDIYNR